MSYIQGNALGLLMPQDQTQAQSLQPIGAGTIYGAQGLSDWSGRGLNAVMDAYSQKQDAYDVGKIGQGQAQNGFGSGISMQQAAEDNPYGYGQQQYDPGAHFTSLYQTGKIIG